MDIIYLYACQLSYIRLAASILASFQQTPNTITIAMTVLHVSSGPGVGTDKVDHTRHLEIYEVPSLDKSAKEKLHVRNFSLITHKSPTPVEIMVKRSGITYYRCEAVQGHAHSHISTTYVRKRKHQTL